MLIGVYFFAAFTLMVYGLNCYLMLFLFRKGRRISEIYRRNILSRHTPVTEMAQWPKVTTQIPIYNEYNVAARVMRAAAQMRYPPGRHEVQVLDDSTDETRQLILFCGIGGWFGPVGEHALPLPWSDPASLPAGRFILLFIFQWVCCMVLLLVIPRSFSSKQKIVLIFALALAGRLLLLSHEPSDDVNRYLWEGKVLLEGFSPYHHAPDDAFLAPMAMKDPFYGGINHSNMTAAYPPLMISMFTVSGLFWYHPLAIKAVMVFFDMGTLVFLVFLLAHRGLDMRWLVLYAFNPIILYAYAGEGHFDVIQGFF